MLVLAVKRERTNSCLTRPLFLHAALHCLLALSSGHEVTATMPPALSHLLSVIKIIMIIIIVVVSGGGGGGWWK